MITSCFEMKAKMVYLCETALICMDAVITYVDGSDPLWQQDYRTAVHGPVVERRYRGWETLPFLLRGIERHMPFIDRVFLVVSRESQVPAWVDRENLKVVLHREIIPAAFLPTFNSTTIELFLHRIPGLSERYLYFNDDIFPMFNCSEEDFFPGGRPATGFARHYFAGNDFKKQTRRSYVLARQALGLPKSHFFLRPQHTCTPMLRSCCESLFTRVAGQLLRSITPVRNACNVNQYVFLDYALLSGRGINRRIDNQHISLAAVSPGRLAKIIAEPKRKLLCINDVDMKPERRDAFGKALVDALSKRFPDRSRFEKEVPAE